MLTFLGLPFVIFDILRTQIATLGATFFHQKLKPDWALVTLAVLAWCCCIAGITRGHPRRETPLGKGCWSGDQQQQTE